jgi:hypothetical protein
MENDSLLEKNKKINVKIPWFRFSLGFFHLLAAITCVSICAAISTLEFADSSTTRFVTLYIPFMLNQGIDTITSGVPAILFNNPDFQKLITGTTFSYHFPILAISPVLLNSIMLVFASFGHIIMSLFYFRNLENKTWSSCGKFEFNDIKFGMEVFFNITWVGMKTVAVIIAGMSSLLTIPLFISCEIYMIVLYYMVRYSIYTKLKIPSVAVILGLIFGFLLQWLSITLSTYTSLAGIILTDVYVLLGIILGLDFLKLSVSIILMRKWCCASLFQYDYFFIILNLTQLVTVSIMSYYALEIDIENIVVLG